GGPARRARAARARRRLTGQDVRDAEAPFPDARDADARDAGVRDADAGAGRVRRLRRRWPWRELMPRRRPSSAPVMPGSAWMMARALASLSVATPRGACGRAAGPRAAAGRAPAPVPAGPASAR